MHWLDVVLLFWLLLSLYMGTRAGFVYASGRLVGLVLGVWLAGRWTPGLASAFGSNPVTTVIVFLVLLSLIAKLGGLLAWVVDRFFRILTIIPFLKTFNKVFGGLLGLVISIVIISMGVLAVQLFAMNTPIASTVAESQIATQIGGWSGAYSFLLPPEWTPVQDASSNDVEESVEDDSEEDMPSEESEETERVPEEKPSAEDSASDTEEVELLEI